MKLENQWKPREIIVHEAVRDDPVSKRILKACPGVQTKFISTGLPKAVCEASTTLKNSDDTKHPTTGNIVPLKKNGATHKVFIDISSQ